MLRPQIGEGGGGVSGIHYQALPVLMIVNANNSLNLKCEHLHKHMTDYDTLIIDFTHPRQTVVISSALPHSWRELPARIVV